MTNLTDKLKKGELPDNHHYYFQMPNGKYEVGNTFCLETLRWCKDGDKIKVLEEVPSYEEWQDLKSKLQLKETSYDFDTARLEEENNKLKELLKECYDTIYETAFKLRKVSEIDKCNEIRKKIREVLGAEYGFKTPKYYVRNRAKDLGEE